MQRQELMQDPGNDCVTHAKSLLKCIECYTLSKLLYHSSVRFIGYLVFRKAFDMFTENPVRILAGGYLCVLSNSACSLAINISFSEIAASFSEIAASFSERAASFSVTMLSHFSRSILVASRLA